MGRKRAEGDATVENGTPERKPVKDRRTRFVEQAERRTVRVIKDIRRLGNCANKAQYDYTADEAARIVKAIESEVANLRHKFTGTATKEVLFNLF